MLSLSIQGTVERESLGFEERGKRGMKLILTPNSMTFYEVMQLREMNLYE